MSFQKYSIGNALVGSAIGCFVTGLVTTVRINSAVKENFFESAQVVVDTSRVIDAKGDTTLQMDTTYVVKSSDLSKFIPQP